MPAKKLTKQTETPEVAVAPAPETPKKTVRKIAAAPRSSAATHKNAAPRAMAARAAAATPRVRKPAATKPAFDAAMHHDEIEREAYFLWEARGYAHGNQADDWSRATELVRARYE